MAVLQLSAPTELKGVLQALCCLPTPAPVCERAALARRPVCSSTHFLSPQLLLLRRAITTDHR